MKIEIEIDADLTEEERKLRESIKPITINWTLPILPPVGSTFNLEKFIKRDSITEHEYDLFITYCWVVAYYSFTVKDNEVIVIMQLDGK